MDKSQLFALAHHKTRKAFLKSKLLGIPFDYRITFSFYLKELTNAQPQKVTSYVNGVMTASHEKKKVNKSCAMVGDYKKPTAKSDNVELPYFILSALAILTIFITTLQAINNF